MAGDLKGLTVTIGGNTTELGKALDAIKTKSSSASKELTQINRLLKMDPGNTDLIAQKQTVLGQKIAATREKLQLLKQAQTEAEKAFASGDIGESEYRAIQRDVIAAQQELDKLQTEALKTAEALQKSGKEGADGAKKTAAAEKEIGTEAKNAEGKVSSFGDVLKGTLASQVIVAGARAIARGVKSIFTGVQESAQSLGELSDNAEKVAMSAEALQSWQYAAKMVGFETEQLVKTMEKQQKAFSNAKTGSQALVDSYAAIGVDVDKLNSSEQAFEVTIAALAECHDEVLRNAIANDIFGKSYADLAPLLNMGAEGIASMRQEAHDLGLVVANDAVAAGDELADTFDTIGLQVDTAKAKLVAGMVPALQSYSKALETSLSSDKTQRDLEKTGRALGDFTAKALNLATKVLPALGNTLVFVTKNGKDLAISAGAAVVAFKGFSIVSRAKTLVNGLTTAVHGFNAAVSSNPIGFALTAVSALISALMLLSAVTDSARERQEELATAYRDAADSALESQRKRQQAAQNIDAEYDHYRDLVKELDSLVDADGRVKAGYEDRVNYIRGELSAATGTEIELVDGVIQKYDTLAASINSVITKKQAEAYLTSNQSGYEQARTDVSSLDKDDNGNYVAGSQAAVEQALSALEAAKNQYATAVKLYEQQEALVLEGGGDASLLDLYRNDIQVAESDIKSAEAILADAKYTYDQNRQIIADFEGVQGAVWADDAEAIGAALESATEARLTAANATLSSLEMQRDAAIEEYNQYLEWSQQKGSTVTAEEVSAKRVEAMAAAEEAYKKMIANSDQYTQEELDAARTQLENQLTELSGATEDEIQRIISRVEDEAREAGSRYVDGVVQGIDINKTRAYQAGYDLGDEVDRGFRANLDIKSPSGRGRRSSAWYPLGVALGIDDERDAPVRSVLRMADKLHNALEGSMSAPALDFGSWGGNLSRYEKNTMTGAPVDLGAILSRLDRIESRVGSIDPNMYLDGQRMSAGLSGYTDAELGRRAAQAARGKM